MKTIRNLLKSPLKGPSTTDFLGENSVFFLFKVRPGAALVYLSMTLASHILPLLLLFSIDAALDQKSRPSISYLPVMSMILITVSLAFIVSAKLHVENKVSASLCKLLETALNSGVQHTSMTLHHRERIVARDYNLVLDLACAGLEAISIPIILFVSITAIVVTAGWPGLVLALCTLAFLPLMYVISYLAKNNYEHLSALVNRRLELSSKWLREGPYLKQFGRIEIFTGIKETTEREIKRRNIDSIYRGADAYMLGFGQILPFCLLALGGITYFEASEAITFWLVLPMVSVVVKIPTTLLDLSNLKISLSEVRKLFPLMAQAVRTSPQEPIGNYVNFDPSWPIWPAQIREFLFFTPTCDVSLVANLIRDFSLVPELGSSVETVLSYELVLNGSNVSEGQRTRLQILRGVRLALMQGKALRIENTLSSLDQATRLKVYRALAELKTPEVELPSFSYDTPGESVKETTNVNPTAAARSPLSGKQRAANTALPVRLVFISLLMMLVPAAMMSLGANLIMGTTTLSNGQIVVFAVLGIIFGTAVGVYVEAQLRRKFASTLHKGLITPTLDFGDDQLQAAIKDSTVTFERICWYTHDIIWIGALLLCSIVSVMIGAGAVGLVVVSVLVAALAAIYWQSISALHSSRLAHIEGFQKLLNAVQTSYIFSGTLDAAFEASSCHIHSIKSAIIRNNINFFYFTRLATIRSRLNLSVKCLLASDLTLIVLVFLFLRSEIDGELVYVAITSLLLVRANLTNAFLALTGFKSHALSIDRLNRLADNRTLLRPALVNGAIHIPAFLCRRNYRSISLPSGRVHSIVGRSGLGKTDYLRSVLGLNRAIALQQPVSAVAVNVIYIDNNCLNLISAHEDSRVSMVQLIERFPTDVPSLFLLDEVIASTALPDQVGNLKSALVNYCLKTKNTIVIVDHENEFESKIDIGQIITTSDDIVENY